MTSAISGKIIYKQGERSYLDANIRGNSLVFDLTNNRLLYSTSGVSYFEFYPGPHSSGTSPVSGSVDWSNILNKPTASNSTSGVLTQADWNTFFNKADVSAISAYFQSHSATPGSVSSVDWSIVQNEPIASLSTSGLLTVTDYTKFNSKADVSAIPSTSGFALTSSLDNYYPLSSTGNISGLTSPAQSQINSLSVVVSQLVLTSGSGGVSAVDWAIVQNEPVASNSTSGVLTQADWNTFFNKADLSAIPPTSGFITSAYVVWDNVSSKPIASLTTSGILTSADYVKFNAKADLSAIPSGSNGLTSANFNENSRIVILNSATANVSASDISSATSLPFYMTGYRSKNFYISGTSSGSYEAIVIFNGAKSGDIDWSNDNNISATISNNNNFVESIYVNNLTKWSGSLTVTSGTITSPGIIAYVEG